MLSMLSAKMFSAMTMMNCGAEIDFTGDDLDDIASGDFVCPECGKTIELDFDECECDCGCDHDHDHE